MRTERSQIQFMTYRHHIIWFDKDTRAYRVALKRDRTDDVFINYLDAMDAIDAVEDEQGDRRL